MFQLIVKSLFMLNLDVSEFYCICTKKKYFFTTINIPYFQVNLECHCARSIRNTFCLIHKKIDRLSKKIDGV